MAVQTLTKSNPWNTVLKAGVPNFDPIFSSGYPYSWFDGSPFQAMRQRPGINHPWIYSAITTIIESYVQCPLRMYDVNDPKKDLIDQHPILDLLKHPNPSMSGTNFLECVMWNLCLPSRTTPGGTCFIWGDDANFRKGEIPDELWLQNDHGVRPRLNEQGVLQAWVFDYQQDVSPYNYGNGMVLDLQEVIRVNFFNPYNQFRGAAPGHPLRAGIYQDASAQQHNSSLLENGMTTKGAFSSKRQLSPQQMEEFRASIDKYYAGSANAGKSLILPAEMDFVPISLSNEDMQYMEQLGWNRDAILAAYKVSKFALQMYEDLNYATAKEAKRQLFEQSILPKSSLIMTELNQSWIEHVGKGNLRLCIDTSEVSALHDDMDARVKRAGMLVDIGIPPIIALKMCEVKTEDLDPSKYPWLMENQSPHAAFSSPTATDDVDGTPSGGKIASRLKKKAFSDLTREEKYRISDDYIAKVLSPGERQLLPAVRKFFSQQKQRNVDLVNEWAAAAKEGSAPEASDFMLDAGKENAALRLMMAPHYQRQAKVSARRARADIAAVQKFVRKDAGDVDSQFLQDDVNSFILKRLKFISSVNDTTFDGIEKEVAASLAESISKELSVADTAKALVAAVDNGYTTRSNGGATNIARTETGVITSYVQNAAMKQAGIQRKAWLSARDEDVRESHVECDAEGAIDFDEDFENGLAYPLDSSGPASEVVNCRCVLQPVRPE